MGWYVETLVTFDAEGEEVPLAAKELLDSGREWSVEAKIILEAITENCGYTLGQKGGVWAIAFTGNYTRGEDLAKELIPFFRKLWGIERASEDSLRKSGPMLDFYRATIITQDEQTGTSRIFVIEFPGTVKEYEGPGIWHSDGS